MKRGEIYWADLVPRSGSEQTGRRPVIIFSHNAFNQSPGWRSIIIVPLSTSLNQAQRGPTVVLIPASISPLSRDSAAVCHQITTLDRSKLSECIGALSDDMIQSVEKGVLTAIDCLHLIK
ncbi:MAG: type II toxin-antitoxin system PemK/MazF family toxin [Steroidobacteraceae bacterium]|nr:type II toxin-antitoxin system PemK/MazF family toxin [Deltaproteobacteria bacterium]